MGLSTKQVSSDHGLDWGQSLLQSSGGGALKLPSKPPEARRQPPQQPPEPVACPRCASMNTKFCYYNNYNKSQPRHFCKACKRHWTKGGTLRNVPVGGGRKNKRQKTSNTTSTSAAATATATTNPTTHMGVKSQKLSQSFSQVGENQDKISDILYHALVPSGNFNSKSFSGNNNGSFLGSISSLPLVQNQTLLPFTFSSLSPFESNPSSISSMSTSFRSPNRFDFMGGLGSMEETTTIMPTTMTSNVGCEQQWQAPVTSSVMGMMPANNYWNWDDMDSLISTQLNIPSWAIDTDQTKL